MELVILLAYLTYVHWFHRSLHRSRPINRRGLDRSAVIGSAGVGSVQITAMLTKHLAKVGVSPPETHGRQHWCGFSLKICGFKSMLQYVHITYIRAVRVGS